MSFALTERQLLDGSKDVTRRDGWLKLEPGTRLRAVRKSQGIPKGQKAVMLCKIEVVSVRRERLDAITPDECRREGFPELAPADFVDMFVRQSKDFFPGMMVTRIEFVRVSA